MPKSRPAFLVLRGTPAADLDGNEFVGRGVPVRLFPTGLGIGHWLTGAFTRASKRTPRSRHIRRTRSTKKKSSGAGHSCPSHGVSEHNPFVCQQHRTTPCEARWIVGRGESTLDEVRIRQLVEMPCLAHYPIRRYHNPAPPPSTGTEVATRVTVENGTALSPGSAGVSSPSITDLKPMT
jgi:hypothetical protein